MYVMQPTTGELSQGNPLLVADTLLHHTNFHRQSLTATATDGVGDDPAWRPLQELGMTAAAIAAAVPGTAPPCAAGASRLTPSDTGELGGRRAAASVANTGDDSRGAGAFANTEASEQTGCCSDLWLLASDLQTLHGRMMRDNTQQGSSNDVRTIPEEKPPDTRADMPTLSTRHRTLSQVSMSLFSFQVRDQLLTQTAVATADDSLLQQRYLHLQHRRQRDWWR